jgi:thioredoxin reductase (NADPH)
MVKRIAIVGGGPAGLSAAINAASEGLEVTLLDRNPKLGGQFAESNDIENYPGVWCTTGAALAATMIQQCMTFGVKFCCPSNVSQLRSIRNEIHLTLDDFTVESVDACILALGLQYRRLDAPGVAEAMGCGVTYGTSYAVQPGDAVAIVGGGNSAGQEAVKRARDDNKVYLIVRRPLEETMSKYLIEQVHEAGVTVITGTIGQALKSGNWLKSIDVVGAETLWLEVRHLMIFIGALPHTQWLPPSLLNKEHYIVTGPLYSTIKPGVFAIGDARAGSIKRIAAAVGEGSCVIPYVHRYLAGEL